jgi:hypothetical protein
LAKKIPEPEMKDPNSHGRDDDGQERAREEHSLDEALFEIPPLGERGGRVRVAIVGFMVLITSI